MWNQLSAEISKGNIKAIARGISFIENETEGYEDFLASLPYEKKAMIIGITGPPGAGKSSLVDALIGVLEKERRIAVLCVDPSSPFHQGALLGDRIRMNRWYNKENVFIRSLAARGSLGGLHPKIIEITDLLQAALFDIIILETVGVGQSEVEVANLADTTVVVLVPEAGDEIQTMKSGLMEIADIFVVNKTDRPDADVFVRNLQQRVHSLNTKNIPVLKTIANQHSGVAELADALQQHKISTAANNQHLVLAQRAYYLIQKQKMKNITLERLAEAIKQQMHEKQFNLYAFVKNFVD